MRRWFRLPRSQQTVVREIDDEIAFHIAARITALIDSGVTPEDARRRAEQEFGDVPSARAELASIDRVTVRRGRRASWWHALSHDARLTLRGIRRGPAFALAVLVTLALGIGVNAAMFGITDRLLLSAPPHVSAADDVVRVWYEETESGERHRTPTLSYREYELFRSVAGFEAVGAFFNVPGVLGRGAGAVELQVGQATATLFSVLGVQPVLGRFFSEAEDRRPQGDHVVVLSHGLWQQRFGGSVNVLGTMVEIDHVRYEVIGVAPRGFNGVNLSPIDVWVPVSALGLSMGGEDWWATDGIRYLQAVARLRNGVAPAVASEQARAAFVAGNAERFAGDSVVVILNPLIAARGPDVNNGTPYRSGRIALLLLGVSALVVLIACVNVINLLLARAMRQRREIGVRLALGISRGRLAAQALLETLVLALAGAALGLLLAHWVGRIAYVTLLPDLDWPGTLVSGRVILVASLVTLLCALVAGAAPMLSAARHDVTDLLGVAGRATYRRSKLRSGLIAVQAVLSVVLLTGAGLFLRSLHQAGDIALGYDPYRVAAFTWHADGLDWDRQRRITLYDMALGRVTSLPQVDAAALSMTQPLYSMLFARVHVPGIDSIPTTSPIIYSAVTPDYFRTMGARLLQGRPFATTDVMGSPRVAIVTQSLAELLWPGGNAIGKCFMTSREAGAPCREVVGVVEPTRYSAVLETPTLMYYEPLAQTENRGSMRALLVRLRGDPDAAIAGVRRALYGLEPGLPHVNALMLAELVAPALQPWRLGAVMFTAFGALALLLASLGLYGVIAYDVTQRRRELGVRLALGARTSAVLGMVLVGAVRIIGAGLLAGLLLAALLARRVEPLLFDVSGRDPLVLGAVACVLLAVGVLAAALPGWRATQVQPVEALRDDN